MRRIHPRRRTCHRTRLDVQTLEPRTTPSTLIYSGTNPRDLVFDHTRNLVYITTTTGTVQRYDPVANALLSPIAIPGTPSLAGADITPDGTTLVVGDTTPGGTSGFILRMDLATGVTTYLNCNEFASYDVVVMSDTRALFTSRFSGSGWVAMRELNLTTNEITVRSDTPSIRQDTLASRAADRSRAFFGESNISSGPIFTYTTATNSFSARRDTYTFLGSSQSAVSRDGALTAVEIGSSVSFMNGALGAIDSLDGIDGGFVFDPTRDVVYGINSTTDELIAFSTTTWREKFRLPVGENMGTSNGFGVGVASIDNLAEAVYVITPTGVRRIDLPDTTGIASRLRVNEFSSFLPTGSSSTFTVTALDPAGNVATGFTGSVSFSANGGSPLLPKTYTFTPADQGTHTFTGSFGAVGTWTLTATSTGLTSGSQGGIRVHNSAVVNLIPVPDRRGMVYDTARDLLYISTDRGVVERYSPMQRKLLAPWQTGNRLKGIDLTPDGTGVLVADGVRGATGGYIRRVDTTTGAVTTLVYLREFLEGGAYDVAAFANNKALFTTSFEGSGWSPLREINLATNAIAIRADAPGGVRGNTTISRGADRSLGYLTENDISNAPMRTYRSSTDSFPNSTTGSGFLGDPHTVNRDGTLIALERVDNVNILNPSLAGVITLTGLNGGMVFDPLQNVLYAAVSNAIRAYSTTTWLQIGNYPVLDPIPDVGQFNSEVMAISDDGRWMFVLTNQGESVQRLVLPTTTSLDVNPVSPTVAGQQLTFTATVTGGRLSDRVGELVTFKNGAATIGTAPLNASGTATLMTATLPAGPYNFTAMYAGDAGYTSSTSANLPFTINPPLGIASLTIGAGGSQRSLVRSITVTFSGIATIASGAFELTKLGASGGPVTLNVNQSTVGTQTVVTLTFQNFIDGGSGGSLSDGDYSLRIRSDRINDAAGQPLDGDGNGFIGGDRIQAFHRFFGDSNGDRNVDVLDFGLFSTTFNLNSTQAGFVALFDFNNDGTIDVLDFGQFSVRLFGVVP